MDQRELLDKAVNKLGEVAERFHFVLVGGCALGCLVKDSPEPPRTTVDVDFIVHASLSRMDDLERELRALGFKHDPEVRCRFTCEDLTIDIVQWPSPDGANANVWYEIASQTASNWQTPSGQKIKVIHAPVFVATKLEAMQARASSYLNSHDLEDIVTVLDWRNQLVDEVRASNGELRHYLETEFERLLGDSGFTEAIGWHLRGERQDRKDAIIEIMQRLAGLRE